jgi:hypothetical protein
LGYGFHGSGLHPFVNLLLVKTDEVGAGNFAVGDLALGDSLVDGMNGEAEIFGAFSNCHPFYQGASSFWLILAWLVRAGDYSGRENDPG